MNDQDTSTSPLPGIVPNVALHRISFPSDELALGTIRRLAPKAFDTAGVNFFDGIRIGTKEEHPLRNSLADMLHIERQIAQSAYQNSVQGVDPSIIFNAPSEDDKGVVSDLTKHYESFGLAGGSVSARKRIESIVSQAVGQAQQFRRSIPAGRSR